MQPASENNESPATAKKTPLMPKRLGLIGLTFLLVIGICLMPVKVAQNEAKAEPATTTALIVTAGTFLVTTIASWLIGNRWTRPQQRY